MKDTLWTARWFAISSLACGSTLTVELGPTHGEEADTASTNPTSGVREELGISPGAPSDSAGSPSGSSDSATTYMPPEPIVVDCANLSDHPLWGKQFGNGPRGYHDLAFTDDGYVIGSPGFGSGIDLVRALYDAGSNGVVVPSFGGTQGMDWLPDGDLVVANDTIDTLVRVDIETGASTPIAAISGTTYGVVVGPDDLIYAATYDFGGSANNGVRRVDPVTGDVETLLAASDINFSPRVLNFSPDFSKLYMGTYLNDGSGRIYVVDLDETLLPSGPVRTFASGVGTGSYHDSLGVDICGNLYMTDFSSDSLWKITPEGDVSLYWEFSGSTYGHGLKWGNGVGDWAVDAIYVPQPYNSDKVMELGIGVPARDYEGDVVFVE